MDSSQATEIDDTVGSEGEAWFCNWHHGINLLCMYGMPGLPRELIAPKDKSFLSACDAQYTK